MKDGHYIDEDGDEVWVQDGKYHRLDGPAIIGKNGSNEWLVRGQYHRIDGPAVTWINGDEEWWLDGKQHRIDGPAVTRYGDPKDSVIYVEWLKNDLYHREDGPAITWNNSSNHDGDEYWFNGIRYPDIKNDIQLRLEVQRWKRQINKSALKESVLLEHKNKKEGV